MSPETKRVLRSIAEAVIIAVCATVLYVVAYVQGRDHARYGYDEGKAYICYLWIDTVRDVTVYGDEIPTIGERESSPGLDYIQRFMWAICESEVDTTRIM